MCQSSTALGTGPGYCLGCGIKCRSWLCTDCGPWRAKQLIAQASSGNPTKFITLTSVHRPGGSPIAAAKALSRALTVMVKRWRRLDPRNQVEYFAVFEATKTGWPHIHVLWRGRWISQKWLSKTMVELNGAKIVSVEKIDDARKAARYVAKYCGKEPHKFGTLKRYRATPGYNLTPLDEDEKAARKGQRWEKVDQPLQELILLWHLQGHTDVQAHEGIAWWGQPPAWWRAARTRAGPGEEGRANHAGEARGISIPQSLGCEVKPAKPAPPLRYGPLGDFAGDRHRKDWGLR